MTYAILFCNSKIKIKNLIIHVQIQMKSNMFMEGKNAYQISTG